MGLQERRLRTYGNWRRPVSAGLGAFSATATVIIFAGSIITILGQMFGGLRVSVPLAAATGLILVPFIFTDRHGLTLGQKGVQLMGWWRQRALGRHIYRSGPLGQVPYGTCLLPGLGARMNLVEAKDSYGRPFAMIETDTQGSYTVVIEAQPDGEALVDQDQIDSWVGLWGLWLSQLGNEAGIIAASVTVETAPDTGHRLYQEVNSRKDPNAPLLALQILEEVVEQYPAGSATVRAWVAVTFSSARMMHSSKRSADQMARDIGTMLPQLTGNLQATGAGACRPMTGQDLCEVVRIAYDPACANDFDKARLERQAGEADEQLNISWSDVGPSAADTAWDYYRHDSGFSTSWTMTAAPRGIVQSSVLSKLLAPHPDVARKRVSILYRPIDAGVAAGLVEKDKQNADVRVSSQPKPAARLLVDQKAATATASEEAAGAGLVNFGIVITATVLDEKDMPDARATIDSLSGSARLQVRPAYGVQDSAFVAGLPLGLVIPKHLATPAFIRQGM